MFGPVGGPLGISLAPYIKHNRTLLRWLKPFAGWYANITGHRQMGLKYDDLIIEERPDVTKALSRLDEKESYDRAFRIRTAFQQSILHKPLPRDQWLKPSDDVRYLKPVLEEVIEEDKERVEWDMMEVKRKK